MIGGLFGAVPITERGQSGTSDARCANSDPTTARKSEPISGNFLILRRTTMSSHPEKDAIERSEPPALLGLATSTCSLAAFVHTGPGHYIGSCAVVIARSEQEARELLKPAMEASGLGNEEIKFKAYELEPQIIHFANGDY